MNMETLKKEIKKNQSVVDNFYEKALNSLEEKNKENKKKVKNMNKEEQRIENEIKNKKEEIKKIMDNESNYINGNPKNRFKDFDIEKKIYDYENKIKKLERELKWTKDMNQSEYDYIKAKNDKVIEDYDKLYSEKEEIDKAIIGQILKEDIDKMIGKVMSAQELKEENDKIFQRNLYGKKD